MKISNILRSKKFLPLYITQFLSAFNDNLFKNTLITLITFSLSQHTSIPTETLVVIAGGIFILPMFAFSSIAGEIADKFEKSKLIKHIKSFEVLIMLFACLGIYLSNIYVMLLVLMSLGALAAFLGPLKYSILTDHLKENELITANGLIESGTFFAILLGTILGTLLILSPQGTKAVCITIILCSIIGLLASLQIPIAKSITSSKQINLNLIKSTIDTISNAVNNRIIKLAILGIACFWFFGATYLSQFHTFSSSTLNGDESIVAILLVIFSLGIAIGSYLCNKLCNRTVSATFVPVGAIGMAVFSLDFYFTTTQIVTAYYNFYDFNLTTLHMLTDLMLLAICGGIYTVPLYSLLQKHAAPERKSRVIAANNIIGALFMVISSLIVTLLLALKFTTLEIFLFNALCSISLAIYICKTLTAETIRGFLQIICKILFRVKVNGLSQQLHHDSKQIIIANHTSFLDAVLIVAFIEDEITFAINSQVAKKWWIKPLLKFANTYPLDQANPLAIRNLVNLVNNNKKLVIFPEGRLTTTGNLMKVYAGPGTVAIKTGADIVPINIDGTQYSIFSYLKDKFKVQLFPQITINILPAIKLTAPENYCTKQRRDIVSQAVYDEMINSSFYSKNINLSLFAALLAAKKYSKKNYPIIADPINNSITYQQLINKSLSLMQIMQNNINPADNVGVLLPNSTTFTVVFFALQSLGATAAILNYTAGQKNILAAYKMSALKVIYTSKAFIKQANLEELINQLEKNLITIVYLEDLKQQLTISHIIKAKLFSKFPKLIKSIKQIDSNQPAVILYTSGSEGMPKGVALSHSNLLANKSQLGSCIDLSPTDKVFNCLPMFHSFGLTGGMILPILSGVQIYFYPTPLHYRVIPELIYDTDATIFFATNTFLAGYAKYAHNFDFHNIRYIFAGAEKLDKKIRNTYADTFGVRIFEGYGATEAAPVICTNHAMYNKAGTVGRFLPGIKYKIEKIPKISEGGKLLIKGPNLMLGYYKYENPGKLEPFIGSWYDTGDIVKIDDNGYVTIQGRAKRFAKIAGEMISLLAVETYINNVIENHDNAIISISCPKKGEKIVLATTCKTVTTKQLAIAANSLGYSELFVPKDILVIDKIPLLGSGKFDYPTLNQIYANCKMECETQVCESI